MQATASEKSATKVRNRSWFARMPRRTLWIVLAILVVAIGVGAYFIISTQRAKAAAAASQPALQTATARTGNLILRASGTGTLIASSEVNLGFKTSGILTALNVKLGDQVKAGDLVATLDSTNQLRLAQAQQSLNQLTSASAIANAQLAVTTAQANVINAQAALGSAQNWNNPALAQDEYAAVVLAKANLDKAQSAYDQLNTGGYISNTNEAAAYQTLYSAQQAYNTAKYYFSVYSQAPSQRQG